MMRPSTRKVDKATWQRDFKLPWREAGPPTHHDDDVDSDKQFVNKELFSAPADGPADGIDADGAACCSCTVKRCRS